MVYYPGIFASASEGAPPGGLVQESSTKFQITLAATNWDSTVTIPAGSGRVLLDFIGVTDSSTDSGVIDPAGANTALTESPASPQANTAGNENMVLFQLLNASFPASGSRVVRHTFPTSRRGRRRIVVLSGASQTIFAAGANNNSAPLTVTLNRPSGSFPAGSRVYAACYHQQGGGPFTVTGNVTEVDDEQDEETDWWVFAAGTLGAPGASVSATFTATATGTRRSQAIIVVVEAA